MITEHGLMQLWLDVNNDQEFLCTCACTDHLLMVNSTEARTFALMMSAHMHLHCLKVTHKWTDQRCPCACTHHLLMVISTEARTFALMSSGIAWMMASGSLAPFSSSHTCRQSNSVQHIPHPFTRPQCSIWWEQMCAVHTHSIQPFHKLHTKQ